MPKKRQDRTVSKSVTDPDCGLFVKGSHERKFAYEVHTACDANGFVLETVVTAGNVHDSVAFDDVYGRVTEAFLEIETVVADSAYEICPEYLPLRDVTTNRKYRSDPKICANCPTRHLCTHSKDCVKTVQRHIWKDYEELADDARYTPEYRDLYARRKETFERVFADAKEKHAMHYTQYRGLAQVTSWVKPKFVAMNLRKFTNESGGLLCPSPYP